MTFVTRYRHFVLLSILFSLSLWAFTDGLQSQEMIGFESRFYLFALEMWQNGPSFFPTTYHQAYPDYPGTSTFLIYLSSLLFGHIDKFTAVLPSAIAAALTVVFTYLIGSLTSKRLGIYAIFFLLMTLIFFKSARTISLDTFIVCVTSASFYVVALAEKRHQSLLHYWLYVLLTIGFLCRGPIGIVIPTAVVCAYYAIDLAFKKIIIFGLKALLLLIICSLLLLALAYHVGGTDFMHEVWHMQVFGRMLEGSLPFYFYFINSFSNYALSFPLAFLVGFGVFRHDVPSKNFLLKLFAWVAIIMIGMSIPTDKKARYILSIAPALALLAAYPFAIENQSAYLTLLRNVVLKILGIFPVLFLIMTLVFYFYTKQDTDQLDIAYAFLIVFFAIAQLFNGLIACFYIHQLDVLKSVVLSAATLSFIIFYVGIIEPLDLYLNRMRDFVISVSVFMKDQQDQLIFYKVKPDGLAIKYLINMPHRIQPIFIDEEKALLPYLGKAIIVMETSDYTILPRSLTEDLPVMENNTGSHTQMVAVLREEKNHEHP